MTVDHLGHSELPICSAIGLPMVLPWRIPPRTRSSSRSKDWRAPRPCPKRLRASAALMSSLVIRTPAGTPSITAVRASPWDSPAVIHRSMRQILSHAHGVSGVPPRIVRKGASQSALVADGVARAGRSAARMTPVSGCRPVMSRTWGAAWCRSMSHPGATAPPPRSQASAMGVGQGA